MPLLTWADPPTGAVNVELDRAGRFVGYRIAGIYPEAERLGYDVLLSAATQSRGEAKAIEALLGHRCEAVILLGSDAEAAYLDELGRRTVIVSVSRRVPHAHVDFVHSTEGKGVRQAMDHLVELGHRRILHLDGGRGPGSAGRRRAYRAAMRRHGLESECGSFPVTTPSCRASRRGSRSWRSATAGSPCRPRSWRATTGARGGC
ncbi:DNA-binding LacI/PurR family transcriptional regulator [Streptomyces sp. V4I2]|nr:DNA-binding LacI/PurR family transcriptional regulator [Streptomyces sp. V4I2]